MQVDEITLSEAASAYVKRIGLPEQDVKEALAGPTSDLGGNEYRIVLGTLPDGRSIRFQCRHDMPTYIAGLRVI